MKKIIIKIEMDDKNDVILLNEQTEKSKKIEFTTKKINAFDIYELLDYKKDNNYQIITNIETIEDGNEKDYFAEIINLIEGINEEVNELVTEEKNEEINDKDEQTNGE